MCNSRFDFVRNYLICFTLLAINLLNIEHCSLTDNEAMRLESWNASSETRKGFSVAFL